MSCLGFYQSRSPAAAGIGVNYSLLKDSDHAASSNALPRQAQHQGLKLFRVQLHLAALSNAWPVELALVQTASGQPDANPVMHQYFNASGAAIGKQISAVRLRRTEHRDHPGQRSLGSGTHVHGFGGEPDGVYADHRVSPRMNRAHPSGFEDGHFTVSVCWPKGTSMVTDIC